ncbi:unnamed protein product [Spirodela intermedia]|uniref:3-ketoacyl-CoA synthase n=1 Tax=Spirodela intermedia TaxID=51605 RepID=A0A7I8JNH0_SPIIN|nr:unnamed protein product [Spirodela intermedia]CAA6671714.1 unnamed protein product [Spirodela intermedia]
MSLLGSAAAAMEVGAFLWEDKLAVAALAWCLTVALVAYAARRPKRVYLLDYACHKPRMPPSSGRYTADSVDFMRTIFLKSGLGNETYVPSFLFEQDGDPRLATAIREAEEGLFSAADAVLRKTRMDPEMIDVVVVTCSMLWPAPSLSSMIVNHCKLRPDVKTFNLSGMARILRQKSGGYALVLATESTSLNWYFGNNRSMLVTNCIFRVGAAAALLTSDPARRRSAMMELVHALRTHHGASDPSFQSALQREDEMGTGGVELSKDLVCVAGAALREHIRSLALRMLPISELLQYACAAARSAALRAVATRGAAAQGKVAQPPVPDFTQAFEHMCFHPGERRLPDEMVEPARMTLHRFGNTSSSSIFYELGYFEAKGKLKRGDRLWMLAFGTGFKVSSLVWVALRDSRVDPDNPWADCAHIYPVEVPL